MFDINLCKMYIYSRLSIYIQVTNVEKCIFNELNPLTFNFHYRFNIKSLLSPV